MKEIHAYLNEDGTYRVEGVVRVADNEEVRDAAFNMSRARITIAPLADANRELMSLTVENNANEKTFEDYLGFIETQLSTELWDWQKTILRECYDKPKLYYCCNRWSDMHWCYEALRLLSEEMERDNGYLPWLYKPDGYTTEVVIYDELEKEN